MDRILEIARATQDHDGAAPLDEATLLTLTHRPEQVRSWIEDDGFAMLIGRELSLVVRPSARGRGLGNRLLNRALGEAPAGELTAWSHGDHPAAAALAERHAFVRARQLWVMRRAANGLPEPPPAPDGIEVRGYRPGDESELLRVNAAAFSHHPEQGGLSAAGLAERMAEPWFDPEGLVEAWESSAGSSGGRLLGFHWTKRHSETQGEVYVVGIDPDAQGRGLGRLLTLAGLRHLAAAGVTGIHLYVEADNTAALRLYSGLGFTHTRADTHVQYARI